MTRAVAIGRRPVATEAEPRGPYLLLLALLISACALYGFHLGIKTLSTSEAYSELAARQPTLSAVVQSALQFDPGKPPLYHLGLHWFCALAGRSEISLRAFSVIWGLVDLGVLFALGEQFFGVETALAAVTIWAFNPLAFVLARWARMYTMLIALALGHLALLWRLRERASVAGVAACAALGAAMLYTHLGALLLLGAEVSMLLRDLYRGRRAVAPWLACGITVALFLPFLPTAFSQFEGLLFGHWLDWIGRAGGGSMSLKIAAAAVAGSLMLALIIGPPFDADSREPIRWCVAWLAPPVVALVAGSIVIRPMFEVRYIAAALPALALLLARGLEAIGFRVRNLGAVAFASASLVMFTFYAREHSEPWREMAALVARANTPAEPIFFESGFVLSSSAADSDPHKGFPQGVFRAPFDYYFSGPNPCRAVDPFQPAAARRAIARAALTSTGAWLISARSEEQAQAEMPHGNPFKIERALTADLARMYHITVTESPAKAGQEQLSRSGR